MTDIKQQPQKNPESVVSVVFVILLMAVLIPATVYAVMYVIELRTKAGPTEKPQKVEVTNVVDSGSTISWITSSNKTNGYVKYGTTSEVKNIAFDKRDSDQASGDYTVHYVDLEGLSSGTLYHYTIVVGGEEYDNNGELYEFRTGHILDTITAPNPVKGSVEDPTGSGEEVIVYMYVQNGNKSSSKVSTLTENRRYTLDLANLRVVDLSESFVDFDGASLYVFAEGADRGEGSVSTEVVLLAD